MNAAEVLDGWLSEARIWKKVAENALWRPPSASSSSVPAAGSRSSEVRVFRIVFPYFGPAPLDAVLFAGSALAFRLLQLGRRRRSKRKPPATTPTEARPTFVRIALSLLCVAVAPPDCASKHPAVTENRVTVPSWSTGEGRRAVPLDAALFGCALLLGCVPLWIQSRRRPRREDGKPSGDDLTSTNTNSRRLDDFMDAARQQKSQLRPIPEDPEVTRKRKIKEFIAKDKAKPKGPLGLTPELLASKRKGLNSTATGIAVVG